MKASYILALALLHNPVFATNTTTLQYLKDCKIIKQRPMTPEEITALQQLQSAEARMSFLQQPLDEMQAKMRVQRDSEFFSQKVIQGFDIIEYII